MTLDEAISHCEEVADKCAVTDGDRKCEREHRQLAGWLKLLKRILDSGDCNECGIKKYCQVVPPLGEQVRYNCPLFVRKEQEEGGEDDTD